MKNLFKTILLAAIAPIVFTIVASAQSSNCADDDYSCKVGAYTRQIASDPKNYEPYYSRGVAYENLKEYDQAIADLTKYIASNPVKKEYLADGYHARGDVYHAQANDVKAVADYSMAIQLFPTPGHYVNRGNAYQSMKDLVKAIYDYNRAIALDVKEVEGYYNRARAYYKQKLYSKAIADLDVYITLNQAKKDFLADGYWNRSNNYDAMGNLTQALKDVNSAIDLSAKAGMYTSRAALYRKQGKIALAEADERMAASMD